MGEFVGASAYGENIVPGFVEILIHIVWSVIANVESYFTHCFHGLGVYSLGGFSAA